MWSLLWWIGYERTTLFILPPIILECTKPQLTVDMFHLIMAIQEYVGELPVVKRYRISLGNKPKAFFHVGNA